MANTKFLDYNGLSKLVEKIKNTYVNIGGSTMTGTLKTLENQPAINFRPNNSGYSVTLNYDTESAEALAINLKNPATSFMINSGVDGTTWTGEGHQSKVTPTIQVRKNCVSINKYIADSITPEYKLDVNGDVKANSFTGKLNGNANSASKLNIGTTGTSTKPVYFNNGVPATCTYELNKTVPSTAVFTDTKYTLSGDGTNKVTITDSNKSQQSITINNVQRATVATYANQYSYNGMDRDFVYDAIDGSNHYIRCKDDKILRANGTNLNKYEFIINSDGKGGCYIYDSANAKGTTWGPNGIIFDKAPANSLVAANGTFITAITDAEIQNEIDKAITL